MEKIGSEVKRLFIAAMRDEVLEIQDQLEELSQAASGLRVGTEVGNSLQEAFTKVFAARVELDQLLDPVAE